MATFFLLMAIFFGLLLIASPVLFIQIRHIFREQKNFERGLKMVPLLIHLPPSSEDTIVGTRDVRDVVDENVSKAEILYGIIASTLQKNFKGRFYGQRHMSFEIIGTRGFIQLYIAVPISLVEVVKQAVFSAYPAARLEEVAEHNVFSPVAKISGTVGGEFTLKEHFAYPIATYQDIKRDPMQSILNALSALDKTDGVGIQMLFRPAQSGWNKAAHEIASRKRKGQSTKSKPREEAFWWIRQLFTALWKPPEHPSNNGSGGPTLSALDQSIVDSIDAKTRHPGFEVLIRVVSSSENLNRADATLKNVIATFALFDAQGKNGFKYTAAKDIERFVTAYIMRFFPPENNRSILNSIEMATLFHFPDQDNIPTSQLERQASKQVDGPRNISDDGLLLGYNLFRGEKKAIRLTNEDRRRHVYVVGQTGTGKSNFLENLALQDMINGDGFAFVDPHGDTAERLLSLVPRERTEDVIYFSPADMEFPMGLNLFEFHSEDQKDFLIQEAINMLYKLYDPTHQGIIGPRYEHWFRNAALTLMSDPAGATFIDIPKVFTDNRYAKQKLAFVKDQTVLDFWNKEMASTSDYHKSEVLGWFVSKFGAFLSNQMMRNIIGQTSSSFDLREIMDKKKILLVNLSKGRSGELNSKLLGMIFVMKFQAAAMSRASIPEDQRTDFCLYVDEFQNFSTDSFATIMSEARKYRLNLIVANQFTTQLTDEIRDAVFGNMGTIVAFRVGQNDVAALSKYFQPSFDEDDLLRVPNFNTITRTLVGGVPTQPFSMAALPPLGNPNPELAVALKQLSIAKFGRSKSKVEAEIFSRLATKEEPRPTATAPWSNGGRPAPNQSPANGGAAPSFLDQWLAKKSQNATQTATNPISATNSPVAPNAIPSSATSTTATAPVRAVTDSNNLQMTGPPALSSNSAISNQNNLFTETIKPPASTEGDKQGEHSKSHHKAKKSHHKTKSHHTKSDDHLESQTSSSAQNKPTDEVNIPPNHHGHQPVGPSYQAHHTDINHLPLHHVPLAHQAAHHPDVKPLPVHHITIAQNQNLNLNRHNTLMSSQPPAGRQFIGHHQAPQTPVHKANMSSAVQDKQEISRIADQIHHPSSPPKAIAPAVNQDPDDTIFIDNEGNFKNMSAANN